MLVPARQSPDSPWYFTFACRGNVRCETYISKILHNAPTEKFEIAGYTDSQGPEEYNMYLSLLRAQSVKSYLVSQDIDSKRLIAQGYGEF